MKDNIICFFTVFLILIIGACFPVVFKLHSFISYLWGILVGNVAVAYLLSKGEGK